jgi:MSHA biogenesis protein MshI
LISLWKRQLYRDSRAALVPDANETGLAVVQRSKGGRPLVQHCGVYPTIEIKADHVLSAMLQSRRLARTPVSGVISIDDYQLVQVETPQVPDAEIPAAVRWKLREAITYPVEEAVIEVFNLPDPSRHARAPMIVAVVARNTAIQHLVGMISPRAPRFDIIDVPELCLRNLSAALPQDERGVALLAFSESFAHLLLTRAGVLYLTRRIDLNGAALQRTRAGEKSSEVEVDAAALALELQRSLDYYESFYDQPPITDLVIAPADARARRLATDLASETSLQVELFDPERLFQIADDVELDMRWNSLIALGAALRSDGAEV